MNEANTAIREWGQTWNQEGGKHRDQDERGQNLYQKSESEPAIMSEGGHHDMGARPNPKLEVRQTPRLGTKG